MIAIGLPWREIFIQEYWKDGTPHYAIANFGKEAIKISAFAGRAPAAVAGPWEVEAGAIVHVEAPEGQTGLLTLRLDGEKHLGLIGAPRAGATQPKGKCATYDGLNGSGGRHTDLWCEQDTVTFKSGGVIELTLKVPANAGIIKYKKGGGQPSGKIAISKAAIKEAVSDTARITADDKVITIDVKKPDKQAAMHTIAVRFDAPKVEEATMVFTDGWLQKSGRSGHGITRGVVVAP